MEKLVYQMFILGTGELLESALQKGLGGVIFFTRDIKTKKTFIDLIENIKSKSIYSLFLSIDQEGGRVERTENIHDRYLSPKYAYQKGEDFLIEQTEQISAELNEYGINIREFLLMIMAGVLSFVVMLLILTRSKETPSLPLTL